MYRFFVPPENIKNGRVSLQGSDVKHISQVLRLQVGDKIHVMDGLGHRFIVQLAEVKRSEIVGRILFKEKCQTESPLRVRMGLHTGDTIKEGDDFFGRNVILAARISAKAQGGEILVSSLFKEMTESGVAVKYGEAREVELKGLAGVARVYSVLWE